MNTSSTVGGNSLDQPIRLWSWLGRGITQIEAAGAAVSRHGDGGCCCSPREVQTGNGQRWGLPAPGSSLASSLLRRSPILLTSLPHDWHLPHVSLHFFATFFLLHFPFFFFFWHFSARDFPLFFGLSWQFWPHSIMCWPCWAHEVTWAEGLNGSHEFWSS